MIVYLWKLYMDMCRDVYEKDCVYMRKRDGEEERNDFYVNGSFWIWQNKQEVDRHILYHKWKICGFIDEYWCFKNININSRINSLQPWRYASILSPA